MEQIMIQHQMLNNLEQIHEALLQLTNPMKVYSGEKALLALSTQQFFFKSLAALITTPTVSRNTKLQATLYLNKMLCQQYSSHESPYLLDSLFTILYDWSLDNRLKCTLEKATVALLEWCDAEEIDVIYESVLALFDCYMKCTLINNTPMDSGIVIHTWRSVRNPPISFKIYLTANQIPLLETVIFLLKCFSQADTSTHHLFLLIRGCYDRLLTAVPLLNLPQSVEINVQVMELWEQTIEALSVSTDVDHEVILKEMCESNQLGTAIMNALQFRCKSKECSFIELVAPEQLSLVLKLKEKASKLMKCVLMQYQARNRLMEGLPCLFGQLMNTLVSYARFQEYFSRCEQFITDLLGVFYVSVKHFKPYFQEQLTSILQLIVFPLLKAKSEDYYLFENEPEEFNLLMEDCCDHQNYHHLKTEICKILEMIADDSDETAQWVIRHCLTSIRVPLGVDSTVYLPLQTSLLVLSIYSYRIADHKPECHELQNILNHELCQKLLSNTETYSNLQVSRILLFMSYNFSEICKEREECQQWIKVGILLTADNPHATLELNAYDMIYNAVDSYFSRDLLISLCDRLSLVHVPGILMKIFMKIISLHANTLQEPDISYLITKIYLKINIDLAAYEDRKITNTSQIVKVLHLLRQLLQGKHSIKDKPKALQLLWSVTGYYQQLSEVHLGDEVALIVREYMAVTNEQIPSEMYNTLYNFVCQTTQTCSTHSVYAIILNQFIMQPIFTPQVAHIINCIVANLERLLNQFKQVVNKTAKYRIGIANYFLLLQNALATHGKLWDPSQVERVAMLSRSILPKEDEPQGTLEPEGIFEKVIIGRAINTIMLCHVLARKSDTVNIILRFHQERVFRGYDAKVLLCCLSEQIFRECELMAVMQYVNIMVRVSSSQQEKSEGSKIKIKQVDNYQHILSCIETAFNQTTQYDQYICTVLQKMKANNEALYLAIIQSLPNSVKATLAQIAAEITVDDHRRILRKVKGGAAVQVQIQQSTRKRGIQQLEQSPQSAKQEMKLKKKVKKQM